MERREQLKRILLAVLLPGLLALQVAQVVSEDHGSISFGDVVKETPEPWHDFSSIMYSPPSSKDNANASESSIGCPRSSKLETSALQLESLAKIQAHLRHMTFLNHCTRARQVDALFLGDSMLTGLRTDVWAEMCTFPGGCANFGVQGLVPAELQTTAQDHMSSCMAPKLFAIMIGTDALTQGGNATDTAEAIVKVAAAIKTAYCRSKLLLLGLLPVVEQAKYQAYEYKDVSESGNDYFRKITTINTYLAKFASHVDGVMFANCHDLFLDRSNSNNIDRLLLQDGIHMTRPGQQLLFRCIKDHLSQAQALEKAKYKGYTAANSDLKGVIAGLTRKVLGVTYKWAYSLWGACSACEEGATQSRSIICVQQDILVQVKDAACKGEPRLPLVRNCTAKCPTYHWVPSPWGSCSEPCGGGKQNRTAVCIGSNGKTAHKHKCQELEKGFDTVQRCNMHSCTFPQSTFCLSDAMCPSNAQCRLLSCSDDACKQAEHWGKKVQFAQQLEAYARDPLPSPWEPLPGADAGLSRFYTANLKVNNAGEVKSGACLGQGSCIGKVVDELPWYIRYKEYSSVHSANGKRCYRYCENHGKCLATSLDGACASWACEKLQGCTSTSTEYHVPGVVECVHTGSCRIQGCQCRPGFTGPECTLRTWSCPDGQFPSATGCCNGHVAQDGSCCHNSVLDAHGNCCHGGKVDACGICSGNGTSVDVLGKCCSGSLDARGVCCEGEVDECGVCMGNGTTCAYRMTGKIALDEDGESRNKSSIVYVDLKLRGLLRSAEKSTGMDGKFTVEEIRLDTNGRGRPYAAWAEFAAYVDDVRKFDDPATDGKPRLERLMQLLQADPDYHLSEVGEFRRTGVCGNGFCEVGESLYSGALVPNSCREDCPFDDSPTRCNQCAFGLCAQATGACTCFRGYVGEHCSDCDDGYARHRGQCVPVVESPLIAQSAQVRRGIDDPVPSDSRAPDDGGGSSFVAVGALASANCILAATLAVLVSYHIWWRRRRDARRNSQPVHRHVNPLNGDGDLLSDSIDAKGHP